MQCSKLLHILCGLDPSYVAALNCRRCDVSDQVALDACWPIRDGSLFVLSVRYRMSPLASWLCTTLYPTLCALVCGLF